MLAHYIFSGSVRLVNFHNRLVLGAVDYNGKPDILTIWHLEDDIWCKHIL